MNKWSKAYQLLRYYAYLVHLSFYRKIRVRGLHHIPKDKPVIFAPNHQNALMDPMGILFTQRKQTIFLTRADIFNNPILLKIFTFLKMLPVYRIRDGASNLRNNERIFNESVRVLESEDEVALALFPEARHSDKRHLWPLKKAVQRISFRAMEKHNFNIDIQIVPVGIYYSSYSSSQTILQVNYGKPIAVKDFEEIYKSNNQKGMAALRDAMTSSIKEQIIHIENQDYNDIYEFVRLFNRKTVLKTENISKNNSFKADQETVARLDTIYERRKSEFNIIETRVQNILSKANSLHIEWLSYTRFNLSAFLINVVLSLLVLPIFVYAFVNHILFHSFIHIFLTKKVKDKQFHSSIKFGISLLAPFSIFLLQAGIFAIFLPEYFWWYYLSLPISAWLGLKCKYLYKDILKSTRVLFIKVFKKKEEKQLRKSIDELHQILKDVM